MGGWGGRSSWMPTKPGSTLHLCGPYQVINTTCLGKWVSLWHDQLAACLLHWPSASIRPAIRPPPTPPSPPCLWLLRVLAGDGGTPHLPPNAAGDVGPPAAVVAAATAAARAPLGAPPLFVHKWGPREASGSGSSGEGMDSLGGEWRGAGADGGSVEGAGGAAWCRIHLQYS